MEYYKFNGGAWQKLTLLEFSELLATATLKRELVGDVSRYYDRRGELIAIRQRARQ